MAGQEPSMRSSEPYCWLDPGPGAKFREFPKASEEGGHALTVAKLQPLRRGWRGGRAGNGCCWGLGPRAVEWTQKSLNQRRKLRSRERPQDHSES